MGISGTKLRLGKRTLAAAGSTFLVLGLMAVVTALPAAAATFSNTGAITIPAGAPGVTTGPASPYPSVISVSGLTGTIVDVNATLTGVTHTFPDDIDILLVGPAGQNVVLMADSGGGSANPISGISLTFDDSASSSLPDTTQITGGTYRPTNNGTFSGTPPAPGGPYGSALSVFNGTNANGTWSLYVYDDSSLDSGSISGGWSLNITMNTPTITSFVPTSGGPGTSVVITGTNFTGATSVTFGGASSTFTVNSPTQITATVPTNAVTGPIAVTTPSGTGASSTNFTFIPAPTVTSFTPTSGKVGTSVVITGTTFTGATAVKFNVTAATFTVNSPTQITATVPAGASTGLISVTTPSGTGSSLTNFIVQHARNVSLSVGRRGTGNVSVTDGFGACAAHVPVKVQHFDKDHHRWKTVASVITKGTGAFSAGGVEDSGRYRALAKAISLASGDRCLKDYSPVVNQ